MEFTPRDQKTITAFVMHAKFQLFTWIEEQHGMLKRPSPELANELSDRIGAILDDVLDDQQPEYTQKLLLCCLEDPELFTKEPEDWECIATGLSREVTGEHCVYHRLYEVLHLILETNFDEWYEEHQERI